MNLDDSEHEYRIARDRSLYHLHNHVRHSESLALSTDCRSTAAGRSARLENYTLI